MDSVLDSFLVKLTFDQDERSRKRFDEGLKQVQTRAAEFGAKIDALPTVVSDATKRISASLTEMYYSAQKNGATARELDALRKAAEQSGEGADKAEASFNAFSQRIRDAASGTATQYKNLFGIDVDPNHTFDAFIKMREKIEELRNKGGAQNLSYANMLAKTFGIDEDALVKGRMPIFTEWLRKQLKQNEGIAEEKAVALTRAYNALAFALENVARKADAALFDKFGAVLDRLTKWLDDEDAQKRIVKFFTDLAMQIGLVFTDLAKLSPAFVLLWDALKEVGGWLQKIIGQPDAGGLAGVRHLIEFIGGVVMARFVASMVAGFTAAFAPLTLLLTGLAVLGVISVGAYTAGEAVRGWFGGGGAAGSFGPGEGTGSGGHGSQRRGRFGHGGAGGRPLTPGAIGAAGSLTALITAEAQRAGIDPRIMEGIRAGESAHGANYDVKDDSLESSWGPFQLNRRRGLGVEFERDTAAQRAKLGFGDLRDPRTIPLQARWVAEYLKKHSGSASPWMGYRGPRDANPKWGESGYIGHEVVVPQVAPAAANPLAHWDPNFDQVLKIFKNAKPLGSDLHSMNQIHDYRSVDNNVNINVASASSADTMAGRLGRPRNADLIRNTASYAA